MQWLTYTYRAILLACACSAPCGAALAQAGTPVDTWKAVDTDTLDQQRLSLIHI